jgi:DNA-binding XRE family transcriptional regulator
MTYGYSQFTIAANKSASKRALGVALGRACIEHGVSVSEVAKLFGVSRQTVYNWFDGTHDPKPELTASVEIYIRRLTKK